MSQEMFDGRMTRRNALRMAGVGSAATMGGLAVAPALSTAFSPIIGRPSAQAAALQDAPEGPFS